MNIDQLISRFRNQSGDTEEEYLWENPRLIDLFNDAVSEACTRKQLLFDATTDDVCVIDIESPTTEYDMHESIVYVTKAYLIDSGGNYIYLDIKDRDELDRIYPTWREDSGEPKYIFVDDGNCVIAPEPEEDYTLMLEVYRTPIDIEMMIATVSPATATSPVIATAHHKYLVDYVLAEVYRDPDADTYSPRKAEIHQNRFNDYFGLPGDADRWRRSRENRPHRNKIW